MNIEDVEKLAELSRMELSQQEKESLLKDMQGILDYVKVIENVEGDKDDIKYDLHNIWREDKEDDRNFSKKIITEQFPSEQNGFLKVKKILQ